MVNGEPLAVFYTILTCGGSILRREAVPQLRCFLHDYPSVWEDA